jgi:hypothetical protein
MLAIYIAVLASATLAVLVRGTYQFISNINAAMFMALMKKLVNAGNSERAIKVCAANPRGHRHVSTWRGNWP